VQLSALALEKLHNAQARLPAEMALILTRGFEPAPSKLGFARKRFRMVGIALFKLLYWDRRDEVEEIFGDVSFRLHGRRVRMLPLGVFTPPSMQQRYIGRVASPLAQLRAALVQEGFRIHGNPTESLQIHCDLVV
jgi:hypothetical protein